MTCKIEYYALAHNQSRVGGSGPVAPALARSLIVKIKIKLKKFFQVKSFCILTFCAACTLSVMYNISFMLIVKMCKNLGS